MTNKGKVILPDGFDDEPLTYQLVILRASRRLKFGTIADAIGETREAVWDVEKGKSKDPVIIQKLSNYYGVKFNTAENEEPEGLRVMCCFRDGRDMSSLGEEELGVLKNALKLASEKLKDSK